DAFVSKQDELDEQEWNETLELVKTACTELQNFRKQEGQSIEEDFKNRIAGIRKNLSGVEALLDERKSAVAKRLNESLKNLKSELADPNRFEQELIYYLEKLDISEEQVRLKNHLQYFEAVMAEEENSGRKLGFICQEIGREINTMGSKANHAEIQRLVVLMKDDLEKIKEQVLNVL
ncbi:MAG: endoribonuclease YicC domain-containing protein, partial [Luteibaculum sp.]